MDKTSVTYIFTEYSSRPNKALSMVTLKEKTAVNEEQEMKGEGFTVHSGSYYG